MSQFAYDTTYTESRNRGTVAIRIILAIPHMIVSYAWTIFAEVLSVVQWFIILFTGKRNDSIWNLQRQWLEYTSRVYGYMGLLYDEYPAFGTAPGPVPVTTSITMDDPANRLTCALRIIWAIPALIISALIGIAVYVVAIISWFAIVITGKHPRGMWDFTLKGLKYAMQTNAYAFLLTDEYPKY